ncbi:DUF624 domain-containing protein [Jeotgalibacillus sp. ET6]|uniref:YesL family protein n=1 Tax=Jeotgalibacillus sp. ET6 TaxID=3037260 RepID=UPI0024185FC7|nr:DUF624 domain-containing protein [Jeotgalibacillus sp. ET6]MDG5471628.1 DUF624 domain-containing protein [Jeotgalibacillus sp. ET6]
MTAEKMDGLYKLCEWVMRLAYLNILWLFFSLLGFVAAGVFPASIAGFTILRQWFLGKTGFPVFRTFWHTYKNEWMKANKLGAFVIAALLLLYLDFLFLVSIDGGWQMAVSVLFFLFALIVSGTALFLFPVYVHYDLSVMRVLFHAFILFLSYPLHSILMGAGVLSFIVVFTIIPSLLPFFGFVAVASCVLGGGLHCFSQVGKKRAKIEI